MSPSRPSLWDTTTCPYVGILALQPLPGSPGYQGDPERVRVALLRDAESFVENGISALLLVNRGDVPFSPRQVAAVTTAWITRLAGDVRRRFDLPLGIQVLWNDGRSALAVAHAVGASFIRVNLLRGTRAPGEECVSGHAYRLLRDRAQLGAEDVAILADLPLAYAHAPSHAVGEDSRPLAEATTALLQFAGADGVIIADHSFSEGRAPSMGEVEEVRSAAGDFPVLIGSGVSAETISRLRPIAEGFLLGVTIRRDGLWTNPVDPARVREFTSLPTSDDQRS